MYAAAGGASLASRSRQRQRQQNNKNKQLQAKLAKAKAVGGVGGAGGTVAPIRVQQSRPFHQLPPTYLRTPQAQARKLSANYTTQSKLLLPIVEGPNNQQQQQQQHPQHVVHQHHQHLQQQQQLHHHHYTTAEPHCRPLSPRFAPLCKHLTKSATATLPLVSQAEQFTPPTTPSGTGPVAISCIKHSQTANSGPSLIPSSELPIPQLDTIIVTPATPIASPGHHAATGAAATAETPAATATDVIPDSDAAAAVTPTGFVDGSGIGQLERKCSFYRVRRTDEPFEQDENYPMNVASPYEGTAPPLSSSGITPIISSAQHYHQQLEGYTTDDNLIYAGLPNGGSGHKWAQVTYGDQELCTCEHIECAQGRAAWLERGRRCSVQDNNSASCHRRWVKRNRIKDSSLGGSSDDEDLLGVLRGPSSFANAFLYVGLGTIAIGLVIAFVGTGEKGFKTVELRLIGPSLIGIGLICCILRICFCICPSHCISSSRRASKKNNNSKIDADHTTSLLRGESKRVSIAKGSHLQKFPLTHKRNNTKMVSEGMEALRQIATTSLFLQNEQKPTTNNRVVPIIKEPEKATEEAPIEMKKLDTTLNICDVSDEEDDEEDGAPSYSNQTKCLVRSQSKLARQRIPLNQQQHQKDSKSSEMHPSESDSLLMETSLMVINPSAPLEAIPSTSKAAIASSGKTITIAPSPSSSSSSPGYDLPPSTPHQYHLPSRSTFVMGEEQQHTPGQIVDTTNQSSLQLLPPALTPKTLTLPSLPINNNNHNSSSSQSVTNRTPCSTTSSTTITTGTGGLLTTQMSTNSAKTTIATTKTTTTTPKAKTATTTTTVAINPIPSTSYSTTISNINLLSPPPLPHSTSSSSEPELVLSPAKLGQ